MIRPHPKAGPSKDVTKGRQRGKSRILTDSPGKAKIEKQNKKKKKVTRVGREKKNPAEQLF